MKYLFRVEFQDGTQYQQNQQDVSENNPERSCFFDIKQQESQGNFPVIFELNNGINKYLVNLRDGHFEVNGVCFDANLDDSSEEIKGPYRLIYFRRHTHSFGQGEANYWFTYNFGWQTTQNGVNIKRIITIKE